MRIDKLARLEHLAAQDAPFYLQIAPYAPHVQNDAHRPIPLKRHMDLFTDIKVPRNPNFNPADEFQSKKGSWLRTLPLMNDSVIGFADYTYQSRAQSLQGVDEIIEDVVRMLEEKGIINNTYIVYTSDNGYHLGQNRAPAGKALFYAEDTNLPFAVRGPGIPAGANSALPSTHVDLAPTFLDIARLPKAQWPTFLDGTSLLQQWQSPCLSTGPAAGDGNAKGTLNIEFWGLCTVEAPVGKELGIPFRNNTYKSVRVLGDKHAWLFTKWCTGDVEMYHTGDDKWELKNLADSKDPEHVRAFTRLNALLMVTKSWKAKLRSFEEAMAPEHDVFFEGFARVAFKECLQVQSAENEAPFYPPLAEGGAGGLGREHRAPTDTYFETGDTLSIVDREFHGGVEQRHATLEDIYAGARELTDEELGPPEGIGGGGGAKRSLVAAEAVDMRVYGYD